MLVDLDKYPEYSVIQNLFHGRTSLIPRKFASELQKQKDMHGSSVNLRRNKILDYLIENDFIYTSPAKELKAEKKAFSLFKASLPEANPSRQYQFILTYACNMKCVYCFQKFTRKENKKIRMQKEQLNNAFKIIMEQERQNELEINEKKLTTHKPLISIVGGEPLIDSTKNIADIKRIIRFVKEHNFEYSITTNGMTLEKFMAIFKEEGLFPRHIQVTIDGPKEIHDKRRTAPADISSFEKIVGSIDYALATGGNIGLRINLDEMNIDSLGEIGDFIFSKGWSDKKQFSAYLAPVTDHSLVNTSYNWINNDSSLLKQIVKLFLERPELESLFTMKNFRGFEYVKQLIEKKAECVPTIWRCEAVLGQLIFDPLGNLYCCFEGAGNKKAKIGVYFPKYLISKANYKKWKSLNSFENSFCSECCYKYICAGGCPWHIIEHEKTECLPIKEEIELAWNLYAGKIIESRSAVE
jgi:uncharacterized protein